MPNHTYINARRLSLLFLLSALTTKNGSGLKSERVFGFCFIQIRLVILAFGKWTSDLLIGSQWRWRVAVTVDGVYGSGNGCHVAFAGLLY